MVVAEPQGARAGRLTLVSGPASSGKSLWAETLAHRSGRPVRYLATGPQRPGDQDWQQRLERHRQRRPSHWSTHDVGLELVQGINTAPEHTLLLVDSLGTWVAAGLELEATSWCQQCDALLHALHSTTSPVIMVSEETGWGVVPSTVVGGRFRQRLGELMQHLMPACDSAWLVLHGRAIDLLACSEVVPPVLEGSA